VTVLTLLDTKSQRWRADRDFCLCEGSGLTDATTMSKRGPEDQGQQAQIHDDYLFERQATRRAMREEAERIRQPKPQSSLDGEPAAQSLTAAPAGPALLDESRPQQDSSDMDGRSREQK
jgi:hypothetical protein